MTEMVSSILVILFIDLNDLGDYPDMSGSAEDSEIYKQSLSLGSIQYVYNARFYLKILTFLQAVVFKSQLL